VAGTLELEEDFLHKSSLSRALCVLSARDQNEEWSEREREREKRMKNHGANEKGQNILGILFYPQLVSHLKEEVFADRSSSIFRNETKTKTKKRNCCMISRKWPQDSPLSV
jgi:hypothetical protein